MDNMWHCGPMRRDLAKNEEDDVVGRADVGCSCWICAGEPAGRERERHRCIYPTGERECGSGERNWDCGFSGQLPLHADSAKRARAELFLRSKLHCVSDEFSSERTCPYAAAGDQCRLCLQLPELPEL